MTVRPKRRLRTKTAGSGGTVPPPVRAVVPFETFYQQEVRSVVGLAYALSGSRTAAEDLAQEAFIAAHRNWDRISLYDRPDSWVRRVVSNLSVSLFRRSVREAKAIARLGRMEPIVDPLPPDDDMFWAAVRALPKRQAQAVALHYLEDRSVAEIADILECSPNTVKVHLHRGRQKLANRLGLDAGGTS